MLGFIDKQTTWYNESAKQLQRFRAINRFNKVMRFAEDMLIFFNIENRELSEMTDKAEDLMVQYYKHVNKKLLK